MEVLPRPCTLAVARALACALARALVRAVAAGSLPPGVGRGTRGVGLSDRAGVGAAVRIAFRCSVGADLGRAAEKPLVADR